MYYSGVVYLILRMKRILYLASFDISKRTGGGLASLCYYNALCAIRSGAVDLMMNEECCDGKYENAIKIPARHGLDYITDFSLHRGKRFIINYLKRHASEYDICVINCSRYGGDMMNQIKKLGLKIIMIHHNYEVEFCMDNKYTITLGGRFAHLVAYYEKEAYKKADVNCYLTMSDQRMINKAYGTTRAQEFLLGVFEPSHAEHNSYFPNSEINTLVCSGSMNDYQTYHSLELFEREYYKIMKDDFPQLKLIITGRNPNETIYEFKKKYDSKIEIVPNPDNIEEVVGRGSIFLCPTCIGGGLKLRVMDGLKLGLPVLVHKVSARGYEKFNDKPYFQVYDSQQSFKKGLTTILSYIQENKNFRNEIIEIYKKEFSFEAGVARMKKIINTITNE